MLGGYALAYNKHKAALAEDEGMKMPDRAEITVQEESQMPSNLRNKEEHHALLYPKYLPIDTNHKFDLACVHGGDNMYRGRDVPAFKPAGSKKTVLGSSDQYYMYGTALLVNGPPDFPAATGLGHSGPKYDQQAHKGDPRDVRLSFRAYTQRPFVRVSIVLQRNEKGQATKVAQWHCYAHALKRMQDDIGLQVKTNKLTDDVEVPLDVLQSYENKTLFSVMLQLNSEDIASRPILTGIANEELEDWALQVTNGRSSDLSPAQRFIVALNQATTVHFFGSIPESHHDAVREAAEFMRTVCYATANYGSFWHYGLATPGKSIHSDDYPFSQVVAPRWLTTSWKVTRSDGEAISAEPIDWKNFPMNASMRFPDASTYGFETKLALTRELCKKGMATAIDRVVNTVSKVQLGQKRKEGIHYANVALGAPVPANHRYGWMTDQMRLPHRTVKDKTRGQVYWDEVSKRKRNEVQEACAKAPIDGSCTTDELLLCGPPGTGKTTSMISIVRGFLAAGLKVVVSAPSNVAVDKALNAFEQLGFSSEGPLKNWDPLNYVRFAGTASRTGVKHEQESIIDGGGDANMADCDDLSKHSDDAEEESKTRLHDSSEVFALSQGIGKTDVTKKPSIFNARLREYIKRCTNEEEPKRENYQVGQEGHDPFHTALLRWQKSKRYSELRGLLNAGDRSKSNVTAFRELNDHLGRDYLSNQVQLVFTTASSSADETLVAGFRPQVGLLDEAAQSAPDDCFTLLAAFQECMLFFMQSGDHKKLSSVATSFKANETLETISQSLLEKRMDAAKTGHIETASFMYDVQYRFHSEINDFLTPLYDNKLTTGDGVDDITELDQKVLNVLEPLKKPNSNLWNGRRRICIDVSNSSVDYNFRCSEQDGAKVVKSELFGDSTSSCNPTETAVAMGVVFVLKTAGVDMKHVTLLTPYQGHRKELIASVENEERLTEYEKKVLSDNVRTVDTVSSPQNKIVINVLTINDLDRPDNIRFIANPGRVLVSASRGERFVFYIGNFMGWARALQTTGAFINTDDVKLFRSLVEDCVAKKDIIPHAGFHQVMEDKQTVPVNDFYKVYKEAKKALASRK